MTGGGAPHPGSLSARAGARSSRGRAWPTAPRSPPPPPGAADSRVGLARPELGGADDDDGGRALEAGLVVMGVPLVKRGEGRIAAEAPAGEAHGRHLRWSSGSQGS